MRKIKKAKITCVSLCPGQDQMPVLFKEDGTVQFDALTKGDPARGEVTALVYVPERPDVDGDFASAEVIKEMAYEYQRDHRSLDLRHDGKVLKSEQAYVAENFIVQKNDPRFADLKDYDGNPVDATGAWGMVIKIEDEKLQKLYQEGEWNGVSMFGTAQVESSKEDTGVLQKIWDAIKSMARTNQEEPDMDEKLRKELESLQEGLKAVTDVVQKMAKDREDEKAAAEKAELEKAEKEKAEKDAALEKENKELKEKLSKLQKASNQDPNGDGDEGDADIEGLSKEEMDLFKLGEDMAGSLE